MGATRKDHRRRNAALPKSSSITQRYSHYIETIADPETAAMMVSLNTNGADVCSLLFAATYLKTQDQINRKTLEPIYP